MMGITSSAEVALGGPALRLSEFEDDERINLPDGGYLLLLFPLFLALLLLTGFRGSDAMKQPWRPFFFLFL